MSACVLWLDTENAKIFKISAAGVDKKTLAHHDVPVKGSHHDTHKHQAQEHFFHEIAKTIGATDELLIFGSGMAKNHFKHHLEKHHHTDLAKHIVGVESLENLTDNQILEASRKFLKKYHMFHPAN